MYDCIRRPEAHLHSEYTLRFRQPLDLSEFVRVVSDAKGKVQLKQARLLHRLGELYALPFTYVRVIEEWPSPAQTAPEMPEVPEGELVINSLKCCRTFNTIT